MHDLETMYIADLSQARDDARMLVGALSELAQAADDPELTEAFRVHVSETSRQIDRLGQFEAARGRDAAEADDAMAALIAKALRTIAAGEKSVMRDTAMIAAAQRIQHYLIATYGTLAAYAKLLGRHEEKRILGAMLEDERAFDEDLTVIATSLLEPAFAVA
jgi:ferritin-like metal-binding protein YciE